MKPRCQGQINDKEQNGLDYSTKRREESGLNKPFGENRLLNNSDTVTAFQELGFDTSTTFENEDQQQSTERQQPRDPYQCKRSALNNNHNTNPFNAHPVRRTNMHCHNEIHLDQSMDKVEETIQNKSPSH